MRMPALRRAGWPSAVSLLVAASLLAPGCGKDDPKKPVATKGQPAAGPKAKSGGEDSPAQPAKGGDPAKPEAKTAEPAPGAVVEAAKLQDLGKVAKHLPGDVVVAFAASSLRTLMTKLGREELSKRFPQEYAQASVIIASLVGHNILDPAHHAAVGIDADAPMGFAVTKLESRDEEALVFFGVSDQAKLIATVDALAAKVKVEITKVAHEGAQILHPGGDSDGCVVLKGDMGFVTRANGDAKGMALAKRIAAVAEVGSLAARADYKAAMKAVGRSGDVVGWVDVATVVKAAVADMARRSSGGDYLEKQLADAKTAGREEEVKRVEAAIAREREWQQRRDARQAAELEIMGMTFGSVLTMAYVGDVADEGIDGRYRLELKKGSALETLLKNASDTHTIVKATTQQPLFLMSANVDPKGLFALLEKLAAADGAPIEQIKGALDKMGLGIDTKLLPALGGEGGLAVTGDPAELMKGDKEPMEVLTIDGVYRVKDAAAVKGLMDVLAASADLGAGITKDAATGRLKIDIDGVKVSAGVDDGGVISVSTGGPIAPRLSGANSFVDKVKNPLLAKLLNQPKAAAVFVMDQLLSGYMAVAMADFSMPLDRAATVGPGEPPFSEAYLAKEKQLKALQTKLREAQRQEVQAANTMILEMMGLFGQSAFVARVEPGAIVVDGGQYYGPGGSLPKLIARGITSLLQMRGKSRSGADDWDKVFELTRELDRIRSENIEAQAKGVAAPPVAPEVVPPAPQKAPEPVAPPKPE